MKVLSKLILVLIIVVPIIICITTLNKVWDEDENYDKTNNNLQGESTLSGDSITTSGEAQDAIDEITAEMAGKEYVSKIGAPISKIYTDASISISVANVYAEANETSEVVGTLEKFAVITAQKYPSGWTRVTDDSISGWMRTENISFSEGGNLDVDTGEKTGRIKADPYLNVRASASSSASIITTIPNGTEITIKEEANGWYKVTYASATGWISADYVTLNP